MRGLHAFCAVGLAAATALAPTRVDAQDAPPRIEATVTLIAGDNAYLDAGAAAGLAAGDTLEAYHGETLVGLLVVVSAADDRAVVAYAGPAFPLTRGTHLALVRAAGRSVDPQTPEPDVAAAPEVSGRPSILAAPPEPDTPAARRLAPSVDGRLQIGTDGLRTATDLPGDLPDETRSFVTPFAALRLRADGIGGGLRLEVDARSSYRWAEGTALERPGDARVYQLNLSGRVAGLDARAGRFMLEHDAFTGAWDGLSVHYGSRIRGVGVAGGLQPDYGAGLPTADLPKAAAFAHAEGGLGGGVSGRLQALVGAIIPTAEGLSVRPFAGVRQQAWGRGFTLSGEAMLDRNPDSTAAWALSRLSGRASVEAAPGVRLHAFGMRRRGYLLFGATQLLLPPSTRAGGGASVSLRGGPVPGTTIRADVSQAWAEGLTPTRSVSGGLFIPRLPSVGIGLNLDATAWKRDDPAGARGGMTSGAAVSYSHRGAFAQVGYRYGRSPVGLVDALTTRGLDMTLQLPVGRRVALTLQASLQAGDVLRSTRVYTALWYRL